MVELESTYKPCEMPVGISMGETGETGEIPIGEPREVPTNQSGEGSSGEDPVWSILPSYYMFSNTINTGVNDSIPDPPNYPSSFDSGSCFEDISTVQTETTLYGQISTDYAETEEDYQDQDARIKETLLDNVHKLKNISTIGNEFSNMIDISVVFTKEIGVGNQPSTIIDPSLVEYRQGDYINGYILIRNKGPKPIPFDMFYCVLEGEFSGPSHSLERKKFLHMFDFTASFNPAEINRLVKSDDNCNIVVLDNFAYKYDPYDNSYMCLGIDHLIKPNIQIKKFFTFKIPTNLLDSGCPDDLTSHLCLPPSFGGEQVVLRDFSTINSSVKYSVSGRFIGRHCRYDQDVSSSADAFVVLKDAEQSFRVVPFSTSTADVHVLKWRYDDFFKDTKERILEGKRMFSTEKYENAQEKDSKSIVSRNENDSYEFIIPLYKVSAFLKVTPINTLQITTPRKEYRIAYIPPAKLRTSHPSSSAWLLDIPIELTISSGGNNKHIEIKSLKAELVVLTLESLRYPLPIELHQDLLFNKFKPSTSKNIVDDNDTLPNNLTSLAKELNHEVYETLQKSKDTGLDWRIEKRLALGVRSLAEMTNKSINLAITNIKVNEGTSLQDMKWKVQPNQLKKSFTISLDLKSSRFKTTSKLGSAAPAYENFVLVPNFQTCHLCRMYYVRLIFEMSNGQNVYIKLPVTVENLKTA